MSKVGQELDTAQGVVDNLIATAQPHGRELETEAGEATELIAELKEQRAELKRLAAKAEKVRKKHAQACAAIEQTDEEYFRVMCKLMDPLVRDCSDHPLVKQWVEVRKIWAEQLLKKN